MNSDGEQQTFGSFVVAVVLVVACVLIVMAMVARAKPASEEVQFQFVSGTEYNIGEAGQVIVEARFLNGTSAIVPPCNVSIWYANKTLYQTSLTSTASSGNEFFDFVVPNATGVYEYQAACTFNTVNNVTRLISKSFHVSEFQNETLTKLSGVRAVLGR